MLMLLMANLGVADNLGFSMLLSIRHGGSAARFSEVQLPAC